MQDLCASLGVKAEVKDLLLAKGFATPALLFFRFPTAAKLDAALPSLLETLVGGEAETRAESLEAAMIHGIRSRAEAAERTPPVAHTAKVEEPQKKKESKVVRVNDAERAKLAEKVESAYPGTDWGSDRHDW